MDAEGEPPDAYLFDKILYDSEIELENIKANISEVEVYTKIPKNSIRIPLVGGGSYSPDFAFVIKQTDGMRKVNLVVESKGKAKDDLSKNEKMRIEHAKVFFKNIQGVDVHFTTQLSQQKIYDLIQETVNIQ